MTRLAACACASRLAASRARAAACSARSSWSGALSPPPPARPWIASPRRHARSVGWGWRRCATASRAAAAAAAASDPPLPKVLVIAGPTAVGKTALSLRLAAALDGEIVSADSVQVFTGLDVGSSKLPESERAGIPHHMLDLLDPSLEFGAGEYCDRAWAVMEDIVARGKTPVVVGGTGMYLRWLVEGKPPTPPSDPAAAAAARAAIDAVVADAETEARAAAAASGADPEIAARAAGWRAATRLLSDAGDAESASKIAENDWYRVERALEIVTASGRPVGSFAPVAPPAFDFRCVMLTCPRVALYRRVDARVEAMTRDGMLEEAAGMLEAGIAPGGSPAARSIGYRQAMEFLARRAEAPVGSACAHDELIEFLEETQRATRAFAKRQFTWFRGEPEGRYAWLDASAGTPEDLKAATMAVFREQRDADVPGDVPAGDDVAALDFMRDTTRGETDAETSRVLKRYSAAQTVYDDPNGEASEKTRGVVDALAERLRGKLPNKA